MHRSFFCFFLFCGLSVKAQFYKQQATFDNFYFQSFNADYLSVHKVKCITVTFASKEEGQRIQQKNSNRKIWFNQQGFPEKELLQSANDSSQVFYYYLKNKLTIIRKFSEKEIRAIYLGYDSLGYKTKEVHCKEEAANYGGENFSPEFFKLGKQNIDWNETYSYQALNKNQTRKKTFNDKALIYKEGIIYADDAQLVTGESERYSVTGISENSKYIYDSGAKLTEKIFFTDVSGVWEEKSIFTYDVKGNISGEKFYRNGTLLKELLYFYNTTGEFPEAILTKYPNRKTIDMQNITIEFY